MAHDATGPKAPLLSRVVRVVSIFVVVCTCGWLVMEMEILGGRILTPHFGSKIYVVWGSVIGTFLLSLSAGYMLGGWLSRGANSKRTLGISLMVAGVWLCALPLAIEPVCNAIFNLDLGDEWGSLLAALALFGVPTTLLGTVSPTAVRWLTARVGDSGLNAGFVLAVSTIASFAGCIVTAFYLIRLSVSWTVSISGGVLALLGAAVLAQAFAQARTGRADAVPAADGDPPRKEV